MKKQQTEPTQSKELEELKKKIEEAQTALQAAQENERRALADYQNLVRRSQEERVKLMKLAAKDAILAILLPLDHLNLAKEQLNDRGLNMVYQQFQQALQGQGVQEIEAIGQPFDEHKMEVVDKHPVNDPLQHNIVIRVTQRGYTLHGEVIQHAKVVIGIKNE